MTDPDFGEPDQPDVTDDLADVDDAGNAATGTTSRRGTKVVPIASQRDRLASRIGDALAVNGSMAMIPEDQVHGTTTRMYLDTLDLEDPPAPRDVSSRILALTNLQILRVNAASKQARLEYKLPLLRALTFHQIALCVSRLHHVVRICPAREDTSRDTDLLAIYRPDGCDAGLYVCDDDEIRTIAREYSESVSLANTKEIIAVLRERSRRVHECEYRDLIAVNNGIFNYADRPWTVSVPARGDGTREVTFEPKTLHPFDPAFVFLTKSRIDFDPNATSPTIVHPIDHSTWEIEEWMSELSDDPEVVNLFWEILGAIIRPHVRWNKSAWFYSERGNNGKGTLCSLMRNLTGPGAHTSIPLADFGGEFSLEPLIRASAIIVDENDVGTFIDKAANIKAVVTNDTVRINRKHKTPVSYQFWGFMVQCLNGYPRFKDKSDSFYRRQLFIDFEKCFSGAERTYIKDDYLTRPQVLRYVMKRVLVDMTYYTLSEPPAAKLALEAFKEDNDPVRAFWAEFKDRFAWDLVPFTFAYDLYRSWFADTSPSGKPIGQRQFIKDLRAIVETDPAWFTDPKNNQTRSAGRMNAPEPLIAEYDLKKWTNPAYSGPNTAKTSSPCLADKYRGIQRISTLPGNANPGNTTTPTPLDRSEIEDNPED